MEAVGAYARAVAWDAPGFGRADKPADFDYTVEGYASFISLALESLGVERAHLVLHDFGGPWGLRWAMDHPERFASRILGSDDAQYYENTISVGSAIARGLLGKEQGDEAEVKVPAGTRSFEILKIEHFSV